MYKNFHQKIIEIMQEEIDPGLFTYLHNRVLLGPFAGMELIRDFEIWDDGNNALKILGLYEEELHDAINQSIINWPKVVVNVGCAGGYYAVGMARRLPEAKIFAFDTNIRQVDICLKAAVLNGVRERVEMRVGCTKPEELGVTDLKPCLYIVDVEGIELELLRPDVCWQLTQSDIIVECHDHIEGLFARESLINRFMPTHDIEHVKANVSPNLDRLAIFKQENTLIRALLYVEKRPLNCDWLVMRTKNNPVVF